MTAALVLMGVAPAVQAKAAHDEFVFNVTDWNDCTGEDVYWDVIVYQVEQWRETPSGRGVYVNIWNWYGTVEGLQSGYLWTSRGTAPYVERYALNGSPAGGYFSLENSVLKPASPGAPRIKLDADFRMSYNANGDLTVERASYTYDCR